MNQKLRILLVQGHRNTSGGNAREIARTPAAARAIQKALQEAGHTADMLQHDNDWYPGGLDAVAREVVRRHDLQPYDLMLDIHFEGDAGNTRGVFAIVPDGDGLHTFSPYTGSDSWASNPLDVAYADAIARGISEMTRLQLRTTGVTRPGVMSERQTGVGGMGYRLAMFGYTARVRHRLVRLVLELGNIEGDKRVIGEAQFNDKAGAGVVLGIQRVLQSGAATEFEKPVTSRMPNYGHIVWLERPITVAVTADALNARKWADTGSQIMRVLGKGNSFWARGYIVGENVAGNPIWWIMGGNTKTDLLWRVWSGGTNKAVEEILALPAKEAA